MSLNKQELKAALVAVFKNEQSQTTDPDASVERLAGGIADAVDAFVKTGLVKVTVNTTGTAAAQSGTGTGNIE